MLEKVIKRGKQYIYIFKSQNDKGYYGINLSGQVKFVTMFHVLKLCFMAINIIFQCFIFIDIIKFNSHLFA